MIASPCQTSSSGCRCKITPGSLTRSERLFYFILFSRNCIFLLPILYSIDIVILMLKHVSINLLSKKFEIPVMGLNRLALEAGLEAGPGWRGEPRTLDFNQSLALLLMDSMRQVAYPLRQKERNRDLFTYFCEEIKKRGSRLIEAVIVVEHPVENISIQLFADMAALFSLHKVMGGAGISMLSIAPLYKKLSMLLELPAEPVAEVVMME